MLEEEHFVDERAIVAKELFFLLEKTLKLEMELMNLQPSN